MEDCVQAASGPAWRQIMLGRVFAVIAYMALLFSTIECAMAFAVPVQSSITNWAARHARRRERSTITAIIPLPNEDKQDLELFLINHVVSPALAMVTSARNFVEHARNEVSTMGSRPKHRDQNVVDKHHRILERAALHTSSVACSKYFHILREDNMLTLSGQQALADPKSSMSKNGATRQQAFASSWQSCQ